MYKVYAKKDNTTICIYDDVFSSEDTMALGPKLELEESCAGTFKIKLVPTNAGYSFVERLNTEIIIKKEDEEIWSGRVISEQTDFWKNRAIECEGELAYLNDTIQPQNEFHNITPRDLLIRFIQVHNSMAPADKQFTVGAVTVTDPNESLYRYSNYESTLATINDKLVSRLGGYLSVRKVNGVRYLDYLAERPVTNTQPIEFGYNLLDFTKSYDATKFCTVLLPLGEQLEENPIEELQSYLTVESVNEGSPYVVNTEAYNSFGWICAVEHWDNVTNPSILLSKATQYLSEQQFDNMELEVQAVDLHYTDTEIESIKLSNKLRVISRPHGLDRYFPLTKMSIPLDSPENTVFSLGDAVKSSLSARTNSGDDYIKGLIEEIPTEASVLDKAKDNADQIMRLHTNGYITITQDDHGTNELYIADYKGTSGEDIEEHASRYWKWNLNGLSYYRNHTELGLALTMDGAIVADRITTGTLNADIIRAGVLKNRGWRDNTNYNAVWLRFTDESITEENYDYVYIYVYDSANNVYRRSNKISGSSISAYSLWIPSGRFWIYWHSDTSVTKYGWSIISIVGGNRSESSKYEYFPDTVATLPTASQTYIVEGVPSTIEEKPHSDHPYNNNEDKLWDWDTQLVGNNVFYLDLDNGILRMNASSLSISGQAVPNMSDVNTAAASAATTAAGTAISNYDNSLTQQVIFNKLTNNGTNSGIYLQGNSLYINATYIQTGYISANRIEGGTLKLGGSNNENGTMEVYDASNTKWFTLKNESLSITKGDSERLDIKGGYLEGYTSRYGGWTQTGLLDLEAVYGTGYSDIHTSLRGKYKLHLQSNNNISLEIGSNYTVKAYVDSDGLHSDKIITNLIKFTSFLDFKYNNTYICNITGDGLNVEASKLNTGGITNNGPFKLEFTNGASYAVKLINGIMFSA